ncbi:MAG: enoyl-CoA hydratase/isomerase family protein [Bacteroidetes bacterium]|nr:enoyl-CoA hydratase/isomerase family protein [Bacteroidota bacterium]
MGVARVTLNRPDVLNSFNDQMGREFLDVLSTVKDQADVRAILLTGKGRAFCAGQDLAEVMPADDRPAVDLRGIVANRYNLIVRTIRETEKPFVCAVNGVAAGAGANLALACDFVVASRRASFIQSFSNIGLVPDTGGSFFLPRLIGLQRANALMMLGGKLSADDALGIGLIYEVVAEEDLETRSLELATLLSNKPTKGLGLTKRLLNASMANTLEQQLVMEAELQSVAGATSDYREGVTAFVEKRTPRYLGR